MITRFAIAFVFSAFSFSALAQVDSSFLAGASELTTETLMIGYSHDSKCPWMEAEAESAIESELLRASIQRTERWEDVFLAVSPSCVQVTKDQTETPAGYAFVYQVRYCSLGTLNHQKDDELVCNSTDFGGTASGGMDSDAKKYYLDALAGGVSRALDDFIRATMDQK